MEINFTGHNVKVTPALKSFTKDKLTLLQRHYDRIMSIHIIFNIEKLSQIAEATVFIPKAEFYARAETGDLYSSIDELMDKLKIQLTKHKEKVKAHHSKH